MWVQCGHLCGLLRSSASASGCLSATCATLSAIDPKASGQWGQASSFDLNQDFVSSGTTGSAKTAGMLWRWCFLTCLLLCSFEAATRLQKVWSLTQSFCLCLSGRSVTWKNLKVYVEENKQFIKGGWFSWRAFLISFLIGGRHKLWKWSDLGCTIDTYCCRWCLPLPSACGFCAAWGTARHWMTCRRGHSCTDQSRTFPIFHQLSSGLSWCASSNTWNRRLGQIVDWVNQIGGNV